MRKAVVLVIAAVFAFGCGRKGARVEGAGAPKTPQAFITSTLMATAVDADVAVMASRQARLPETRQLGATMYRMSSAMRADLARIAQHRRVPLPKGVEEKKVALKDNLSILPGQIFDRAYALAMVQDMNAMLQSFDAAAALNDAELRDFIGKYRGTVQEQQRAANRLLGRLGGSPWPGVSP